MKSLVKAEWQQVLFGELPRRLDLLALEPEWPCQPMKIKVFRNHALEPVAASVKPYAAFGDWIPEWDFGGYDDSFSFLDFADAAAYLLWLDRIRYPAMDDDSFTGWLVGRINALRSLTSRPILMAVTGLSPDAEAVFFRAVEGIPGVAVARIATELQSLQNPYDPRLEKISGARFSAAATILLSRTLGCKWLPAILFPSIKAIATDLDNTLHVGVLGEEGKLGVSVPHTAESIQKTCKAFKDRGGFVNLLSKNDFEDAKSLFVSRAADYPLSWEDFFVREVSWNEKHKGMAMALEKMRISPDAVVFLDDNPGELLQMEHAFPSIKTLHINLENENCLRALEFMPGLFQFESAGVMIDRNTDLQAAAIRNDLQKGRSVKEYCEELQINIELDLKPVAYLKRLHELCRKTNQFNMTLKRSDEARLHELLHSPAGFVAAMSLRDRLSDSGLIGVISGIVSGRSLKIEEICISCRALGRHLEDMFVFKPVLLFMEKKPEIENVEISFKAGEKNSPALEWLKRFESDDASMSAETGVIVVTYQDVKRFSNQDGVVLTVEN